MYSKTSEISSNQGAFLSFLKFCTPCYAFYLLKPFAHFPDWSRLWNYKKLSSIQDQAQPRSSFRSWDMKKNRWLISTDHCKISIFREKLANFGLKNTDQSAWHSISKFEGTKPSLMPFWLQKTRCFQSEKSRRYIGSKLFIPI